MSKQFQFSRPVEYDPSLAASVSSSSGHTQKLSKQEELKDEFGFESEESEEEMDGPMQHQQQQRSNQQQQQYQDDSSHPHIRTVSNSSSSSTSHNNTRSPTISTKSTTALTAHIASLEASHADDLDRLARELSQAQSARLRAEDHARQTEARMESLSTMSKQAKTIMTNKFKQQLKTLQNQVEEQKQIMQEDEEVIENMKEVTEKYEGGEDNESIKQLIQQTIASWKDIRAVKEENIQLRAQVDETQSTVENMREEVEELKSVVEEVKKQAEERVEQVKAEADAAVKQQQVQSSAQQPATVQQAPPTTTNDDTAVAAALSASTAANASLTAELHSVRSSLQTLESTVSALRSDSTKQQQEKEKLIKKLAKIMSVPEQDVMKNVEQEWKPTPTVVVKEVVKEVRVPVPTAGVTDASGDAQSSSSSAATTAELLSLQAQLSSLQSELASTQHQLVQVTSENESARQAAEQATQAQQKSDARVAEAEAAVVLAQQRVTDAGQVTQTLQSQLTEAHSAVERANAAASASEQSVASLSTITPAREVELQEMIKKLDDLLVRRDSELNEVKEKAKEKLVTASNAIKKLKTEYGTLRTAYTNIKESLTQAQAGTPLTKMLLENLPKRKTIYNTILQTTTATKTLLSSIKDDLFLMHSEIPSLGLQINQAVNKFMLARQADTLQLRESYRKEMSERKKLFNQIQEMKGNIRVYCRVRPMNDREREDKDNSQVISFPAPGEMSIINPEKKLTHTFEFEKIFDSEKVQTDIFPEVEELVTSVMDGYNVCIFAYGQTGSGKTYTMTGGKTAEEAGVNIRSLTKLFEVANERHPDVQYEISCSLLEIYNEKIQDLLGEKGRVLKAVQGQYGMEVQDLTMVRVTNEKEVLDTLKRGSKNRSVSATTMNEVSSRSHLILSTYVKAKNFINGKETMGKMHLIDLAGSERVARSGVTGDAMKEAQAINSSLSALGNVISARANKSAHVPYRDSTLTYLLQDSLEKNSKTLMFVQVSPVKADASESICSLKFAERVRKVELGKSEVNAQKKK